MKGLMNKRCKRAVAFLLAFFMIIGTALQYDVMKVNASQVSVTITESAGYEEGAYAEWAPVEGADGYQAYVSKDGTSYTSVDNELIREYADYWRVDAVGLTAGTYYIKVDAVKVDADTKEVSVISSSVTGGLTVTNYDRSGFSFSSESRLGTGSGAYNDDGSLKKGAQVVYVTADTAKTCTAIVNGTEQTGIQAILDAKQKKGTENDILCIRIVGLVKAGDVDKFSSSSEGIQIKGKAEYNAMNITIEGIGEDAAVSGFGFLVRNAGNVEFRNFAIMNFMDDGISIDTKNTNIWVHDMDFFYGSVGGDADQAKGDGTVDMKGDSQYITVSYNHFWDAGKASLCGMKSETGENFITYHHNWFDHSDSRHPRIRTMSVHVYNNYYDGNSKYGVGAAYQSQAFVEANYFNNCKYPMLISKQGSDVATDDEGTFSGEDGGIIKAYNNIVVGAQRLIYANSDAGTGAADAKEFDAYLASTRAEQVPSTYSAKKGGKVYNNFDTNVDLGVAESAIDAPEDVPAVVTEKAGRLGGGDFKWDLSADSEDTNYDVIAAFKSAIVNYKSSVVSIGGISANIATDGGNDNTGAEGGDSTGGEEGDDTEPEETVAPSQPVIGAQIQNFTESGKESAFFAISGNLSTSKGTVTYNGLTLTQCLKMESATNISFTSDVAGSLTLVFAESGKKVKVDGEKYTLNGNVLTMELGAGQHTITKGDSINLFYMVFAPEASEEPVPTESPVVTEEPTEAPTEAPEPTVVPTEAPTATPEPTVAPTEAPTATPEPTVVPTEAPVVTEAPTVSGGDAEAYVQNFTESGKESAFFTIDGNLSTSKGTVEYNGLTLTTCLKMETATNISFTARKAGTLTMVFDATAKKIKVDGQKYTLDSNVFTIELGAGEHAITKGDSMNLFYMVFVPEAAEEPVPTEAPTATPEPTAVPTEAPTATPEPTAVPTEAPTATPEPTAEPTEAPTATPEPTAVPTEAPTATPEPTAEPTEAPTATPTVAPTATPEPTAVPTEAPTATPEPTAEPTEAPTATPTVAPTVAPTAVPTAAPTVAPTAVPTVAPTVAPTEAPVVTPEPTMEPEVTEAPAATEAPTATPNPTNPPKEDIQDEDVPAVETPDQQPDHQGGSGGIFMAVLTAVKSFFKAIVDFFANLFG